MKNYKTLVKKLLSKGKHKQFEKTCIINGKFYVTNEAVAATFNLTEDQMAEYETSEWSNYSKTCCEKWLIKEWNFTNNFKKFHQSEISKALESANNADDVHYITIHDGEDKVHVCEKFAKFLLDAMKLQKVDFVNVYVKRFDDAESWNIPHIYAEIGDDIRLITYPICEAYVRNDIELYIAQPDTIAYDQIKKEECRARKKLEEFDRNKSATVPFYEKIVEKCVDLKNTRDFFHYPIISDLEKDAVYVGNETMVVKMNLTNKEINTLDVRYAKQLEKRLFDLFSIPVDNYKVVDIKEITKGIKQKDKVRFVFNGKQCILNANELKKMRFIANKLKSDVEIALSNSENILRFRIGDVKGIVGYITEKDLSIEKLEELRTINIEA